MLVCRRCCSTSHAIDNRRRKRKQELKLDAADQEAEDAERAAARQKREEESVLRATGEANTTQALYQQPVRLAHRAVHLHAAVQHA